MALSGRIGSGGGEPVSQRVSAREVRWLWRNGERNRVPTREQRLQHAYRFFRGAIGRKVIMQ